MLQCYYESEKKIKIGYCKGKKCDNRQYIMSHISCGIPFNGKKGYRLKH